MKAEFGNKLTEVVQ